MKKEKKPWRVVTREKRKSGRTFVQLKYRRHLVRELPFITNRELKYVVAIFQKTADGLNLLKITPSTMKEFTDRHREKFPVEELEQQELGVEA